ncbi:MAG: SMC-Scp complex subunit ScpB [Clostridia bacterium]|nr:SMC-Scp complex subunit ScpB [Clostridia bacterium]
MDIEKKEAVIEAMLFAVGRPLKISEICSSLEVSPEDAESLISNMQTKYGEENRGIEIVKLEDGYQLATKKDFYEYLYPIFDNRSKPSLSAAALEVLSIIAYNPRITRAEIEAIRGVNSDGTLYRLLEYHLIEDAGKLNAPGKPTTYRTTLDFLKLFGISSLDELPELPKYKLDENEQIVLEDISAYQDKNENNEEEKIEDKNEESGEGNE